MPTYANETLQERYGRETMGDFMRLEREIESLKKAARMIHDRPNMTSGSLEMFECDALCKSVGLDVWTWSTSIARVKQS